MAYNNFIPTIWSETFLHECEQASVYLDDCYTEFQGEIKKRGSEIIFSNVGTPTVTIKDRDDANEDLPPVETVPDSAFKMVIRRLAQFDVEHRNRISIEYVRTLGIGTLHDVEPIERPIQDWLKRRHDIRMISYIIRAPEIVLDTFSVHDAEPHLVARAIQQGLQFHCGLLSIMIPSLRRPAS